MNKIYTVEEINFISVYCGSNKDETLENIFDALPQITEKSIALRMFDLDYPIFIIDKDGNSVYPSSRAEIEQHSGMS